MSQQKHRQQLTASRGTATQRNFQPRVTKAQQRVIQARQTVPTPGSPSEISPQAAGDLQPVFSKLHDDFAKKVNDAAWDQLKQAVDTELQKDAESALPVNEPEPEPEPEPATDPEPVAEPVVDDSPETDDGPLLEQPEPAEYET